MAEHRTLKRTLTLGPVVLYGVGTILGAGIYVLIGEVAGVAGVWAPLSFLIAAVLAGLTGLSFAELSNRYPVSAGEAVYVQQAFGHRRLSLAVGLLVVLTGIVSSATLVNGFAGYFREFFQASDFVLIPLVCIMLGGLAAWGIAQSVAVASVITVAEVGGLIAVIVVAMPDAVSGMGVVASAGLGPSDALTGLALWTGVLSGAGVAFYAFIGFEDMVNVSEEVKDVRRVMPRAIVLTLAISALLYIVVAVVVVRAMPLGLLVGDEAPLATVFETATGRVATEISVIALFAVLNGALIQVVMAARVLYGASSNKWLPPMFGRINARTQTPVVATVVVTLAVLVFALWLPLGTLARLTSFIILVIFTVVNIALVRIKSRDARELTLHPPEDESTYRVPIWVPVAGAGASAAFGLINFAALVG
jgi:basic amino acid/polyamine antiporter, APA family